MKSFFILGLLCSAAFTANASGNSPITEYHIRGIAEHVFVFTSSISEHEPSRGADGTLNTGTATLSADIIVDTPDFKFQLKSGDLVILGIDRTINIINTKNAFVRLPTVTASKVRLIVFRENGMISSLNSNENLTVKSPYGELKTDYTIRFFKDGSLSYISLIGDHEVHFENGTVIKAQGNLIFSEPGVISYLKLVGGHLQAQCNNGKGERISEEGSYSLNKDGSVNQGRLQKTFAWAYLNETWNSASVESNQCKIQSYNVKLILPGPQVMQNGKRVLALPMFLSATEMATGYDLCENLGFSRLTHYINKTYYDEILLQDEILYDMRKDLEVQYSYGDRVSLLGDMHCEVHGSRVVR